MDAVRRHQLSARQRQILLWACRGKTYAEIGLITGLGFASVKTYLDASRFKLNTTNIAHACAVAVAGGIFTAEEILLSPSHDQTNTPKPPQIPPSDPQPQTE